MGEIILLDENTINQIAAGEVVDRPASIVKELIENAIDAGSNKITVEIKNGGIKYIKITDNGCGIRKDDIQMAFERHATSKIRKESDILRISSMGFRGEALASVSGISKVTLTTRHKDEQVGIKYVISGGNEVLFEEVSYNQGTSILVEDVFYNVPARYKFLKQDSTEARYIEDVVTRLSLIHPKVIFKYINNNKEILQTSGDGNIQTVIYNVFGKDAMQNVLLVDYKHEGLHLTGVVGKPSLARSTRQNEYTYINKRFIKDKVLNKAIEDAYDQSLSIGKFPFAIVNLEMNPAEVDVNVHPAKLEVKFQNESKIYQAVYHGVKNAVEGYKNERSPFRKIETLTQETVDKVEHTHTQNNKNEAIVENTIKETSARNLYNTKQQYYNNEKIEDEKNNRTFNYIEMIEEAKKEKIMEETKGVEQTLLAKEVPEIEYRYIGNVFNTYIIIEIKERMYIIDQHAAHERLLYEKIKKNYYSKDRETQMLLIPILVELRNNEKEIIITNSEMFKHVGFIFEDFGDNGIKISGVPNVGYELDYKEMFLDGLDELMGASKTTKEEKEARFLSTLACKAAIKGNMNVTVEEQKNLINEMIKLENPFTCPHGRPTAYEISKYEIERKFLRK
ncbi:MAG: DNA mismatch repair endonuclease MutL [Clostridia bacterium]|nr:DNA mismatch repair endonuclease MutL [Clostridia bacterium]